MPDYLDNAPWHSQRDKIKKVVIENGVTNIGRSAFQHCKNLTSITIPESVTSIGVSAFYNCSGLASVTIPNSVTSIGVCAFQRCSGLTSINIPNSVTSIEGSAFSECTGLTSITIGNSVTSIGDHVFYGCPGLTSIIVDGNNEKYDSRDNCNAIIQKEYNAIIKGCKNTIIPNTIKEIVPLAFQGCSGLTSISIPNSVSFIGWAAFDGCSDLKSITLSNSISSIEDGTFGNCSSLTSITIPNSVTSIGDGAFVSCSGLSSVTIPNSVTNIEDFAFYGCFALTSVTIPNSVTSIGKYAFQGCLALTSITIGNSVTSIGEGAFSDCAIHSITIPNSVTSFGTDVFRGSTYLASINIEKGNAKYDNRNNSNAIIETKSNTLISGCINTTIPNSVTCIGDGAFAGFFTLTSVVIPESVTSIGDDAFYDCSGLTSITCEATTPPTCVSGCFWDVDKSIPVYVPANSVALYKAANEWKEFTNIQAIPKIFALTDGETFDNVSQLEGYEISYTRTFNNTKWQALYIPFSMSYDDWKNDFDVAYINGIRQIDTNNDNVMDETIMDVFKIEEGSLIPNTPYLIRAKTTGEKTISLSDATIYPTESNSIDCSTTIAKYTFTGTYNTIPASTMETNGYYAMGGGSLIMTDGESDLKPFRWYLSVEARSPMYNVSNAAKTITIRVVDEESVTTGITNAQHLSHNTQIYDLNGRKVNGNALKSGLYIKDGKKVVIQ